MSSSSEIVVINGIRAKVARGFFERARGLIGREALPKGEGLLIPHCNLIHTCFMRFAIDATFLGRDNEIIKRVRKIRPWRLFIWGGWRARKVLETTAETMI